MQHALPDRKCRKDFFVSATNAVRRSSQKMSKQNHYTCPKCGGYFRVHAYRRIQMVLDEGTFEEWDHDLVGENPMNYKGYPEKVNALQAEEWAERGSCHGKRKN